MKEYIKAVLITILISLCICIPLGIFVHKKVDKQNKIEDTKEVQEEVIDNSLAGREKRGKKVFDNDNYKVTKSEINTNIIKYEYIVYNKENKNYLNEIYEDKLIYYFENIDDIGYMFVYVDGSTEIYNIDTEELVKTIKGYYDEDNNSKYVFNYSISGIERNQIWNTKVINNEYYQKQDGHVVNSNDTVSIKKGNGYSVIDFNGNTIVDKIKFSRLYCLEKDYIAVEENKKLNIYDSEGSLFLTVLNKAPKDLVVESIVSSLEYLSIETNYGTYNYNWDTGEIKKEAKKPMEIPVEEEKEEESTQEEQIEE